MERRGILALAVPALIAACGIARAQTSGTADGTLTLNGKAIRLTVAYACIARDNPEDDQRFVDVLLADRAVDPLMACSSTWQRRLAEAGTLAGVRVRVRMDGDPFSGSVCGPGLPGGCVPAGFDHRFQAGKFDERHIAGRLFLEKEDGFAGDTFQYDARFAADVAPDPFVLGDADRAALAAMAPGTAVGTFAVNGQAVRLTRAYAVERRDFHGDPPKRVLLLSDAEIPADVLLEGFGLQALAREGRVRAIEVELEPDGRPEGGQLYHPVFFEGLEPGMSLSVSVSGMHRFVAVRSDADGVSGRLFLTEPSDFLDDTFFYGALFHAAVLRKPPPTHEGVRAAKSEPGKAAAAFFQAARRKDGAALRKMGGPELAAELDGPDGARMLEMMAAFFGTPMRIVAVTETGDRAEVVAVGGEEGSRESTTLNLIRVDGKWRIAPP